MASKPEKGNFTVEARWTVEAQTCKKLGYRFGCFCLPPAELKILSSQCSVRWYLSLNLSKCKQLVEGESNSSHHMGTPGQQVTMKQKQAVGSFGVEVNAGFKPILSATGD